MFFVKNHNNATKDECSGKSPLSISDLISDEFYQNYMYSPTSHNLMIAISNTDFN